MRLSLSNTQLPCSKFDCRNACQTFKNEDDVFVENIFIFKKIENKPSIMKKYVLITIFLLISFKSLAIDESSVILEDKPLIEYKDIVSYDSANHTFFLTAAKKQELMKKMNTKDELALKAFALVVDKEIIYTGYFWHPYSSLSCDWFTIDSFKLGHKGIISIELGSYTGIKPDIKDRRNDKRLLKVLEKNGKIN